MHARNNHVVKYISTTSKSPAFMSGSFNSCFSSKQRKLVVVLWGDMAGVPTGGYGVKRSTKVVPREQRNQSAEALSEWRRSCELVENETPSTSPPYWDSDDDDDRGPKPSELYGTFTWNIEQFSQINKRELKSNTFEIGGHKWYILIYPQGCDVCNHLSLFLCVANHEKLLPGWGHFAQFTIAVVNKDPKKSKYSDTLHRFMRREHDWGWKKFMELSTALDGFIDADTLIIQAQVQVIRERADRPFRCLDCTYRRELVRVYLTNVEQICRNFAEERQGKIGNLIAEETRWSSFRAFWLGRDQKFRCDLSREKIGPILKVLVKHFFIEKEVTSTLVMDSLYSGLKALEGQHKGLKRKGKYLETEELPTAIVRMDNDTFVLVDDVLTLLQRSTIEPLPPKDEKAPQNRTKDGCLGEEFNKDLFERDDRRLTEMGRRTIEIFTLAHIFSKIEVAYREDVSLKRQEELIREEELACLAEIGQKARRGAADKEKKSKKNQGKHKRKNCKGKDKGKDDKHNSFAQKIKMDQDIYTVERKVFVEDDLEMALGKFDAIEDIVSDASDSVVYDPEILQLDSKDRDMVPLNWDTDISQLHPRTEAGSSGSSGLSSLQNGMERSPLSVVDDDSSSTCSSDSVPFIEVNAPHKGNSGYQINRRSPGRGTNHQSKVTSDPTEWVNAEPSQPSKSVLDVGRTIDGSGSSKAVHSVSQVADRVVDGAEKRAVKEEETGSLHKSSVSKDVDLPRSPSKNIPTIIHPVNLETKRNAANDLPTANKSSPERYINKQADKASCTENSSENKFATLKPTKIPTAQHTANTAKKNPMPPMFSVTLRPSSAPLIPISTPAVTVAPAVQRTPILPRSASSTGWLGPEPPQSYRNATVGGHVAQNRTVGPEASTPIPYSQAPVLNFSFGMVNCHDVLPNRSSHWIESPQRDLPVDRASLINDMQSFDLYRSMRCTPQDHLPSVFPTGPSGLQGHLLPDDFPHLDIINDLLDDEHGIGNLSVSHTNYQGFGGGPHYLNQQVSFPGDPSVLGPPMSSCRFDRARSYSDDGFQHGFSRTPYDARLYMVPQAGLGMYANGQIDDLVPPHQWQMDNSDLAFVSFGSTGSDPYRLAEYQNPSVGMNGYTVFRPSSGL